MPAFSWLWVWIIASLWDERHGARARQSNRDLRAARKAAPATSASHHPEWLASATGILEPLGHEHEPGLVPEEELHTIGPLGADT